MLLIRSFLFTSHLFLSVLVYAPLAVLAMVFGRPAALAVARTWGRQNFWLLRVLCRLDYSVEGREHIPDENCVVYIKHSSAWETIAQLLIFGEQSWVLKRELLWIPVFGWALYAMRPIAIDRGAGRRAVNQVMEQGSERLASGLWICIFPEGHRMPPGTTKRYGISGALLAQKNGRVILPVAHNAGDFWGRHSLIKRPGHIRMIIGPPISTEGKRPEQINAEAQGWIEGTTRRISSSYGDAKHG